MMPGQQRAKYETDYIDVAARIAEVRERFPEGRLRPADPTRPYMIEVIDGTTYIVVVAAFYRTADDPTPAIGMAYEVFPGKTNFTRGSELQNAETSAWGRAMVASLQVDTKKGIASAQEVRNRREEQENPAPPDPLIVAKKRVAELAKAKGHDIGWLRDDYASWSQGHLLADASIDDLTSYAKTLEPSTKVARNGSAR